MSRKVSIYILGILFLLTCFVIHYLIKSNYSIFKNEWNSVTQYEKSRAYLGLDGESVVLPFRCNTCALIGNSGHLLDSIDGEEIDDRHSCVFRLGFSPTRGYEGQVGSRTTARIVDSLRFYPFLKHPLKLFTGPYSSEFWFLFDSSPGDIGQLRRIVSGRVPQKYGTQFLWFSRLAEKAIMSSPFLKTKAGSLLVSPLWFATRVIEDAGCNVLRIYGIPEAQICKKNLNVSIPSCYWDSKSADLCLNGVDASAIRSNSPTHISELPTVAERRALPLWAHEQRSLHVSFRTPLWHGQTALNIREKKIPV